MREAMQRRRMGGKNLRAAIRKSVELEDMPEEVDLDHLGPNDAVTKDAVAADSDAEQTLCPDSANGASRDGFQTPEGASGCAMAERPSQHPPPPPPSVSPTTPNHHHHHQNHHHSPKSHVPRSPPALPNGCPGNKAADEDFKSEEEKIQEYLQRSDTAVIYPEPVDGETDAHNGHASPSPAPLVDEVPSNGKATDKDFYLKCPHCAKASSSIDALRSHLVTQHGASDPLPLPPDSGHPCDKCSATFALKEQLEKHEQLHSPSGQVVNLDFIDGKGTWNAAHVTACKVCSKTFANVYRLQRHMISHDESAVLRKFKCPECEKAFKFKHHLKEHIRIHSGEKPFVCPNCGKRFSHSGSYSSHMTSKKCLVMNLKVPRRTVDKPVRPTAMGGGAGGGGTNGRRTNPQGGAFTPILPKYGENGLELSSPGYVSGSGSSTGGSGSVLSPENFGLDFSHPFLSPYAPLPQYPLMAVATAANQIYNSGFHPYPNMPPLGSSGHVIRPSTLSAKHADEAKQPPTPPTPPKVEPPSSPPGAFTSSAYGDMNVVHKILAAVNATVSKQQQQGVGKPKNGFVSRDTSSPSLPPLTRSEAHSPTTPSPPAASPQPPSNIDVKRNGLKSDDSHCRYCGHFFESKIDLHQHERYLCKLNGDIFPRPPPVIAPAENASEHAPSADQRPPPPGWTKDAEASTSPRASSTGDGQEPSVNGYSEPDDDFQSDECADGNRDNQTDERKVRMRSLIADEHLAVLRAHYDSNPRPSKEEVQRLAMQLKFSTRVVQVWFQNMRARDKKRGRTFQESSYSTSANIDKAEGASNTVPTSIAVTPPPPTHSSLPVRPFSAITPTPFGPVMPHFNGVLTTPRLPLPLFYPPPTTPNPFPLRHNGHCSPTTTTSYATAVSLAPPFPMDGEQPLDLSLKSKERPMSSSSSCHSPASDQDGEVLNLSHKSSRTSTPCKESNNHVTSYGFTPSYSSHSNSTVIFSSPINTFSTSHPLHQYHPLENSALFKYIQREGLLPSSHSLPTPPGLVKIEDPESAHMDDVVSLASTNDLRVHDRKRIVSPISLETPRLHQILASGTTSSPPPHLQESPSLNGTVDSTGHVYSTDGSHSPCGSDHEDQLEIDEAGDGKRIWKQAEGEDSQLDLDDSSLGEDDRPIKRRKSWKQHKLDSEEGLYACDQCDKVFSKQSSLARHKYEHSGQRPHKCDVCGKAFKHKHHLTEHKRLHSGEKPFQCKKCLKRFSHSGSYSQHMNHRYSYCKPYRE